MMEFIFAYGNFNKHIKSVREGFDNFINVKDYSIDLKTLDKFKDDNIFFENEKYIIVLNGVIFNKNELIENEDSWLITVIKIYESFGESFFEKLRGSFSGLFYDKEKDKWLIFTDHISSKSVFLFRAENEKYLFASKIIDVYNFLNLNDYPKHLDINSSYMLLSYGYMIQDSTLEKNIKKLLPGYYYKIEKGKFSKHLYHKFSNKSNYNLEDEEIIENIDILFRQAIKRQFDKDLEYGYKHFVGLSGGLDSRMTSLVAHQMGYTDQLNYTFSQSDYLDQTIPQKIAADLNHEWIFKALDNGNFLKDVDEITTITGGNSNYYGIAHGMSMYKWLDFSKLGVCHTGQLGDVILGTYSSKNKHIKSFDFKSGANLPEYVSKIDFSKIDLDFDNEEMFKFYQRGFSGINSGLQGIQKFTETHSPFYDVDFMNFALSIPVEKRYNHKIYFEWIEKKYPEVQKYIWEKTKTTPKKGAKNYKYIKIKNRKIDVTRIHRIILKKMGLKKFLSEESRSMNPHDYWFKTNKELFVFFKNYYNENLYLLDKHPVLKADVQKMFNMGSVIHMIHVISLLSALKTYEFQ